MSCLWVLLVVVRFLLGFGFWILAYWCSIKFMIFLSLENYSYWLASWVLLVMSRLYLCFLVLLSIVFVLAIVGLYMWFFVLLLIVFWYLNKLMQVMLTILFSCNYFEIRSTHPMVGMRMFIVLHRCSKFVILYSFLLCSIIF